MYVPTPRVPGDLNWRLTVAELPASLPMLTLWMQLSVFW